MDRLTYRDAGVDIEAGDEAVRRIAPLARATFRPEVLGGIGGFAGFVRIPKTYREPVLVSSTDGVGTKLKVAFMTGRHDTVGIDLVAMGVNDVLVHGAEPLYFLDYIGIARSDPDLIASIVAGVAAGCRQARCALIGGETAELPDFYRPGEYDLAGFAVGVVERKRMLTGSAVRPGDLVLGLASSGLHSNGYSLARRIVFDVMRLKADDELPDTNATVADELLRPTRIYVNTVRRLLGRLDVRAMAHITGGGMTGNLPRVLPKGCRAVIDKNSWRVPAVFRTLQRKGNVAEDEMFRTFNMGIGYVLIVRPPRQGGATRIGRWLESIQAFCARHGDTLHRIGEIRRGPRGVEWTA
jgi:phosphoribosylformylglycinamidine cyclo-ligase